MYLYIIDSDSTFLPRNVYTQKSVIYYNYSLTTRAIGILFTSYIAIKHKFIYIKFTFYFLPFC